MSNAARATSPIRVLALGRSNAARTLSTDARAQVIAAPDELTAIGELGSLPPGDGAPTLVLISERARRLDSLPQTLQALRELEPGARFVAVMEGRQKIDAIPGIDAWVHADDSADALLRTAQPSIASQERRPAPVEELEPARPMSTPIAHHDAPQAHTNSNSSGARTADTEPTRSPARTALTESAALDALTHGQEVMPRVLDLIGARLGAGSLRYVDAAESSAPPTLAAGEHAAPVVGASKDLGWLVGPACIAGALDAEARTLALWITARDQIAQLRQEAYTDPLTGAWNRRYFERFANSIIQSASSARRPVTILLFDIDDFKHYNDAYGHEAGDDILRETVRLLNSTVRSDDRVCRIGGDEFAVVFNEPTGPRDASSHHPTSIFDIASRFRRLLRDCRFRHVGQQTQGRLTISGGLATYPWDGGTLEQLVRHADGLILESKRQGKNVICYGAGCTLPVSDQAPPDPGPDA